MASIILDVSPVINDSATLGKGMPVAFRQALPDARSRRGLRPQIGGMLSLAVAMGIGRFAYTPLLPVMRTALHWSVSYASGLAAVNYAGYWVGGLTAGWRPNTGRFRRLTWVRPRARRCLWDPVGDGHDARAG